MPNLNEAEIDLFLKDIKNTKLLSINANEEEKNKAEELSYEYIKNGIENINNINPLVIYYIISKLPEKKQINFIKENIKFIRNHDEDIFLYDTWEPKSLSYFFTLNVLKELKNIEINIFKKVLNGNRNDLFHGFTHEDYYIFYTEFYDELLELENIDFINCIYYHNKCCYDNIIVENIKDILNLQIIYNKEFIDFILKKYEVKINRFKPQELLKFTSFIEDIEIFKSFVNKNYEQLNVAFDKISEYELKEYLSESDLAKQEIVITTFFKKIIKKQDIRKIIHKIKPNIIIKLYNNNKELFKSLTLNDWIVCSSRLRVFNDDFRHIIDNFKIENIESLFSTNLYISDLYMKDSYALEYVEKKYRDNIKINNVLEEIDNKTSIFSGKYLKNLCELKEMLKNNVISKSDVIYKRHLSNFIIYLKNRSIIDNVENNSIKEIEKLFYRIVMGKSLTILYKLSSIEEITIINRLGKIDFSVTDFTLEQLANYNIKHHKQLYRQFEKNGYDIRKYKCLILKLIFMIGFNNAKNFLEIDNSLPTLEHLVGNVDVKNVNLDEQGNPILNNKLMNILFSDKNNSKIKQMLSNKDNDLYKYFPRIFSEWEIIKMNDKDKSLKIIIDFLKNDEISLIPKYYRLQGLFKFIGCRNSIVNETLALHDQMLNRLSSTIPRITGKKDEYIYEILRLDDMDSLSVGNKTDCCFTVLGNGYSCLKHAVTSQNGRILVVKKDNKILAHSWLWRNGDLLCFDNIETSKGITQFNLLDIYLQVADELMKKSFEYEGIKNCIKNITIGFTNFDREIKGIEKYPCLISKSCDLENEDFGNRLGINRKFVNILPQPIEEVGYSDSKNVQYLIRGNGIFNLGQSYFKYQDDRRKVMYYSSDNYYEEEYIKLINKKINALRYVKAELTDTLNFYETLNVKRIKEAYCNDDWYSIVYLDGDTETFVNSLDIRVENELNSIILKTNKILEKAL